MVDLRCWASAFASDRDARLMPCLETTAMNTFSIAAQLCRIVHNPWSSGPWAQSQGPLKRKSTSARTRRTGWRWDTLEAGLALGLHTQVSLLVAKPSLLLLTNRSEDKIDDPSGLLSKEGQASSRSHSHPKRSPSLALRSFMNSQPNYQPTASVGRGIGEKAGAHRMPVLRTPAATENPHTARCSRRTSQSPP